MSKRTLRAAGVLFSMLILSLFLFSDISADIYSSISGRVIAEDTGEGVADIFVTLFYGESQKFATTDKNGFYIFKDIRPGNYPILFGATDYYIAEMEAIEVTVPRGKNVVNVNKVLKLGGAVSGQVFYSDGITPVVGATVSYNSHDPKLRDGADITNENGRYLIEGIAPTDNAEIEVSVLGYYHIKKQNITITKGQTTENINFILPSTETGVSGTVIDSETGLPIEDALASLEDSSGKTVGEARTDASGKYSIVGVPPGTYGISAFSTEHQISKFQNIVVIDKKITIFDISLTKDPELNSQINNIQHFLDLLVLNYTIYCLCYPLT